MSNQHLGGWSEKETNILKKNIKKSMKELEKLLPGRSIGAIEKKKKRLKESNTIPSIEQQTIDKLDENILLEELSKRGWVSSKTNIRLDKTYKFPKKLKPFKIGVVSDTHLGSTQQQLTFLHKAYKEMKEEGIETVYHPGDIVEGSGKMFLDQPYEMFVHGGDAMVDYVIKAYPREEGITTYIIGGNHDYSYFKDNGIDIVKKICEKREDIKYLGTFGAYVNIGNISIYLMHPDGGGSYALSYKPQKIIEQFTPQKKPHIILIGHYHVPLMMPCYRNVNAFQLPGFQAQTTFLKRKGKDPVIGYLILEITPNERGIERLKSEWRLFYEPISGDY